MNNPILKQLILVLIAFVGFQLTVNAQDAKKIETTKIKVSVQCETCKKTIETALKSEKGVSKSNVDLKTKEVEVTFDKNSITKDKIKQVISKVGYDADELKADEKAYNKLNACCKKPSK